MPPRNGFQLWSDIDRTIIPSAPAATSIQP
jgi:hypothetical protein